MKMAKTLVAAMALSMVFTASADAAKNTPQTEIAPEALAGSEPAPANYDPALKAANEATGVQVDVANPIVVLDPGHGGSDPGAVGNGIREADITLDIANRTYSYMTTNYPATVYRTRTADTSVSLDARTTFANSRGANFFTSMHINSYSSSTANGVETYSYPGSTNGARLASNVHAKYKGYFSIDRGLKTAEFYVLKYTNMPSILGETGFISNPTDAGKLAQATFRQNLAVAYSQGMHVYWWGY
jgi:N-acetylmuramoyl-L-alanine amidase